MPYTATYVDDGKGLHKTGSGIVTSAEVFASAIQETLDETRARKLRYGLIDFSDVTEMKVTPEDIRRVVEMNRKLAAWTPNAFVAIVAPAVLPYAISRLWHSFTEDLGWKINLFRTRPDAKAWLHQELATRDGTAFTPEAFPSLHS